jgi:Flp pilus assembly protein TadG
MKMLKDLHVRTVALMSGLNRPAPSVRENVSAWLIGWRACARLRSNEEGQALVETALMITMLLTFAVTIAWFSISIYNRTLLDQAANEGAIALRNYQNQNVTNPCANALAAIQQATSLDSTKMTITYYENGSSVSGGSCVDNLSQGDSVGVTIQFHTYVGPFFGNNGDYLLTAQSTLQVQ